MTRLFNEARELRVGHRVLVHPKPVDCDWMGWRFLRVVFVRAHHESAAGDPDHVWEWWFSGPFAFWYMFYRGDID
jgi:hypothetical protein